MTVQCLTSEEQNSVIYHHTQLRINQVDLAQMYRVSRRTIQRVLENVGLLTYNYQPKRPTPAPQNMAKVSPISQAKLDLRQPGPNQVKDDTTMLQMLRHWEMTPKKLYDALSTDTLSTWRVECFLIRMHSDELAQLAFNVAMVKNRMFMRGDKEQPRTDREAAND